MSVAGTFVFVFQADTGDLDEAFEGLDRSAEDASKNTKDLKEDMRGVRSEADKTSKASKRNQQAQKEAARETRAETEKTDKAAKKYQKTQKKMEKGAEQSSLVVLGAMKKFIGVAAGILAVGATGGMFGKNFFDVRALQTFSEILGLNAQEIDTWSRSVALAGGTSEGFKSSLTNLVQGMNAARMGNTAIFEAFARMGVSLEDKDGNLRDPFDTMLSLSDRLSQFTAPDALLWGSQLGLDSAFINFLRMGPEAVKAANIENASPLSPEDLKRAEEASVAMKKLSQSFQDLKRTSGTTIQPVITTTSEAITSKSDSWTKVFTAFNEKGFLGGVFEYAKENVKDTVAIFENVFSSDEEKDISVNVDKTISTKRRVETDTAEEPLDSEAVTKSANGLAADTVLMGKIKTEDDGFLGGVFDFDFSMGDVLDPIKSFFAQLKDMFSNLMTFFDDIMARVKKINVSSILAEGSEEEFRAGATSASTMIENTAKTIVEEKIRTDAFKKTEQFITAENNKVEAEKRRRVAEAFIDSPMLSEKVINIAAERSKRRESTPAGVSAPLEEL